MTDKPLLVGMNNPYGDDPEYALYPLPERATGWRIWQMLRLDVPGASAFDYRDAFDRRNLQVGEWSNRAARPAAEAMRDDLRGRTVLLFGAKVRDAFEMTKAPFGSELRGGTREAYVHWLPHPSGLCQWYNDEANRLRAARLLGRLYRGERGLLTV